MKPGPTAIIACPACGRCARLTTFLSGTSISTRHWTDGKLEAPALPQESRITRCGGCATYFWTSGAEVLGYLHHGAAGRAPREWIEADPARQLSSEEYLEALERGLADSRQEEVYLRVSAWWRANDARRRAPDEETAGARFFSSEDRRNLRVLYERLALDRPDARLMKAEIARELGEFARANRLLDHDFRDPDLRPAARLIGDLIARGIQRVQEVR